MSDDALYKPIKFMTGMNFRLRCIKTYCIPKRKKKKKIHKYQQSLDLYILYSMTVMHKRCEYL